MRPTTGFVSRGDVGLGWAQVPGGIYGYSFDIGAAITAYGTVDTIVTAPLRAEDFTAICCRA